MLLETWKLISLYFSVNTSILTLRTLLRSWPPSSLLSKCVAMSVIVLTFSHIIVVVYCQMKQRKSGESKGSILYLNCYFHIEVSTFWSRFKGCPVINYLWILYYTILKLSHSALKCTFRRTILMKKRGRGGWEGNS